MLPDHACGAWLALVVERVSGSDNVALMRRQGRQTLLADTLASYSELLPVHITKPFSSVFNGSSFCSGAAAFSTLWDRKSRLARAGYQVRASPLVARELTMNCIVRARKVTCLLGPYSEGPSVEETGCHLGARQSSVSWTSISHLTSPEGQESVFEHTP